MELAICKECFRGNFLITGNVATCHICGHTIKLSTEMYLVENEENAR